MAQTLSLKISGLYSDPNNLGSVPEGALEIADDVVIDRESVVETRRGQYVWAELPVGSTVNAKQFIYENKMLTLASGIMFRDDGEGNLTAYQDTFDQVASGVANHATRANQNLYVTTSSGIRRVDDLENEFEAAGAFKALGGVYALTGSSGFLPDDSATAYRLVWFLTDANDREIVGAPSPRVVALNLEGSSRNVQLTWYIPDGITTDWSYRIYRSATTGSATTIPNDELQLVKEGSPTSAEITAQEFTVTDLVLDSLRGAFIYTAPNNGEGIVAANEPPPIARDLTTFKEITMYAGTKSKHRANLDFVGVSETGFHYQTITGTYAAPGIQVSGTDTTFLNEGMRVVSAGVGLDARIDSIDSATVFTMNVAATGTGTLVTECQDVIGITPHEYFGGSATDASTNTFEVTLDDTPGGNIETTSQEFTRVINLDTDNEEFYAFYVSSDEDPPGKTLLEERGIGGDTFFLYSSTGDSFNPTLPSAQGSVSSDNDDSPNRIYISKFQQPDAVPLGNSITAGSENDVTHRIIALRDSVFVLRSDGVFQIKGEAGAFSVSPFDTTIQLRGPETAVVFNNQIFCYTDQGVVAISETASPIRSIPIKNTLLRLSSDLFANFDEIAHAVSYESDRKYILYVPTTTGDTYATQVYVYNDYTGSFTRWTTPRVAGRINPADDRLYTVNPENKSIYRERKQYTADDYVDEQFEVTISAFSGTTITIDTTEDAEVGYTLRQGGRKSKITEVTDATTLEVEDQITWDIDDATIYKPITSVVKWHPNTAVNPGIMKHFREFTVFALDATFPSLEVAITTNFEPNEETVTIRTEDLGGGWGQFPWGTVPWGQRVANSQPIRSQIPLEMQRCHWINFEVTNDTAFTAFTLAGISVIFEVMSERFGRTYDN